MYSSIEWDFSSEPAPPSSLESLHWPKLLHLLLSKLVGKALGKRRKWFLTMCTKSLAKVYGKDRLDLEVIMSIIFGLKDKERLLENMGDL
jgi:hypothetical protein